MDFEQGLTIELSVIPGLSDKVFPIVATQGTKAPYLTYSQGSSSRTQNLGGYNGCLVQSQYQLDLYHDNYANLKALKKLVISSIKSYNLRNIAIYGPLIQQVDIITDFDTYEDGVKLYKSVIEFDVHYNE